MATTAAEVEQLKHAPAVPGVLPVILERWSPRSFADRDVSTQDLRTLFEAARWAASSYNEQPWRFLVGSKGSETYNRIFESLGDFNKAWAKTAPVLILGAAKTTFSHDKSPNAVALYDLGAAAATICYQATALGLHTHQMGGYDRNVARRLFAVPEDFTFGAVMALGYLGDPQALAIESQRQQEVAPRTRKELRQFVFSAWDEPANLG